MQDSLCLQKCSYQSTWLWCNSPPPQKKKTIVGLRNFSKFAFTTFISSVKNFLKPNNMERKAILGTDIMFSQPNKNELKSKEMMVIFLPLDHISLWSKASLRLWRKNIGMHFLCFCNVIAPWWKLLGWLNYVECMTEGTWKTLWRKRWLSVSLTSYACPRALCVLP